MPVLKADNSLLRKSGWYLKLFGHQIGISGPHAEWISLPHLPFCS